MENAEEDLEEKRELHRQRLHKEEADQWKKLERIQWNVLERPLLMEEMYAATRAQVAYRVGSLQGHSG